MAKREKQKRNNPPPRDSRVVNRLLALGITFIVISIFLTLTHYFIDKQLGDEVEKFRLYGLDVIEYQINEQSAINTSFMILLGTEIVPKYRQLNYFKQHFHVQNIETLSSLHRVLFGKDPDPTLIGTWNRITEHNAYQDEKKKMFDRAILFKDDKHGGGPSKYGLTLLARINTMKKWKDYSITTAIILQVIGLLLNQIAMIKKNTWKEE
jgi:hypothetical protein